MQKDRNECASLHRRQSINARITKSAEEMKIPPGSKHAKRREAQSGWWETYILSCLMYTYLNRPNSRCSNLDEMPVWQIGFSETSVIHSRLAPTRRWRRLRVTLKRS